MLEHVVVHLYNGVDDTPFLLHDAVPFDVGREVPRAEAIANSSDLVNESILPV